MKKNRTGLVLRKIIKEDAAVISEAFTKQGWDKPIAQYERYFSFQETGERDIIVAIYNNEFSGYLTICWKSDYIPFAEKEIPEVVDFNVLKKYQRLGIGTALMDEAVQRIKAVSKYAGIGVGVTKDYGAAQILYVNRAYIPDGRGLTKENKLLPYGEQVIIDDSLVFHLIKELL